MAKYVSFTYTSDAWARMIRTATIRQVADSLDGSVECVYWMFGTHDGIVRLLAKLGQGVQHCRWPETMLSERLSGYGSIQACWCRPPVSPGRRCRSSDL
jgi:hypothetical protein